MGNVYAPPGAVFTVAANIVDGIVIAHPQLDFRIVFVQVFTRCVLVDGIGFRAGVSLPIDAGMADGVVSEMP